MDLIDVYNMNMSKFTTEAGRHNDTNASYDSRFTLFKYNHSPSTADQPEVLVAGESFFAYVTPVIFIVGLIGNTLSLAVFSSKRLRQLSASAYLIALSLSDLSSLVFYVLVEWLRRGLKHIYPDAAVEFLDKNGICQCLLFIAYLSRMMSAWTIVVFTIERFSGVCYPLKPFKPEAKKILLSLLCIASILVLYKPILSGEYTISGRTACSFNPNYKMLSFILDLTFAGSITLVPFCIITVLNILIVRKLFLRNIQSRDMFSDDSKIRLEFTIILLAISFFFIFFNLPYSVVWMKYFLNTHPSLGPSSMTPSLDHWKGILIITRTIFFLNYCANFFLYSITGRYFRQALVKMFCCVSLRKGRTGSYIKCHRLGSSHTHLTVCSHRSTSIKSNNEMAI